MARTKQPDFKPAGWPTVTPRIFTSDVRGLVAFIARVFDAEGTYQRERPSEMRIGESVIMVAGVVERRPTAAFLYVYVSDADATYARAIAAGAEPLEEPRDTPYGDRRGMVKDDWGNTWQIATRQGHTR
jgi:PhnB protein